MRIPDGPPPRSAVLVVHGFKGFKDWAFFPYVCRCLAASGHAVVSFNFSGSGIGSDPERFTELEAFAANTISREIEEIGWVVDWILAGDLLPRRPRRLGLLGHSRGGGDAVVYAAGDDRVRALVTWCAVSTFDRWGTSTRAEWRESGRIYVLNSRTGQQMPLDVGLLEDVERNRDTLDVEAAARRIAAPWLILHGESDGTVELEEARALARAAGRAERGLTGDGAGDAAADIAGDMARGARFHIVAGAGHTWEVGHPFAGPSPQLEEALGATVEHFATHLGADPLGEEPRPEG